MTPVDCIMLVRNVQDLAAHAVLHLLACTPVPLRFIFIDNGSEPPIEPRFRAWLGPEHVYLRNEENRYVYAETNRALALVQSDYVIWCATDHLVLPGWYAPLHTLLRDHDFTWVAPAWTEGPYRMAELWESLGPPPTTLQVQTDRIGSSCLLLNWKKAQATLGGFDPRFQIVFGDTDYLERMRDAGHRFGVCLDSHSRHLGSQTCRALGVQHFTALERADAEAFHAKWAHRPDILARHPLPAHGPVREAATVDHWQRHEPQLPGRPAGMDPPDRCGGSDGAAGARTGRQ